MRLVTILAVVHFTLPCNMAAVGDSTFGNPCGEGGLPEHGLAVARLYAAPNGLPTRVIAEKSIIGLECAPESLDYDPSGPPAARWIVLSDTAGNVSCASNILYPPPDTTTDVPPPVVFHRISIEWYDLLGRRVERPTGSGVYWQVTTTQAGRKVKRLRLLH
jgi:hypothetical protein